MSRRTGGAVAILLAAAAIDTAAEVRPSGPAAAGYEEHECDADPSAITG